MRKLYLFAAMAAMLAACSSDDLTVEKQVAQQNADDGAVQFTAYVNRGTTRVGTTGDIDNGKLEDAHDENTNTGGGFGVFAYYTENKEYDQQAIPNFMYNQLVAKGTSNWEYTPIKYWPNEYGQTAISADQEKISFFAYAPYVDVDVASGKVVSKADGDDAWGITALSRNTAAGDPIVKYIASFKEAEAVDLLWGVCEQNTWAKTVDGKQQVFPFGKPWIDVERPYSTDQRMKFNFKHATAKMQVMIDHFVDDVKAGNDLAAGTRIFIRSVRFNGFAMKGALNLNNEDPNKPHWLNYNGVGELESTGDMVVYDGRRDGKEAMPNATASNEKSLGLNKAFIETEKAIGTDAWSTEDDSPSGVTKTLTDLFDEGGVFYVIPIPDTEVEVEIVYDVETIDKNLAGYIADGTTHGSSVENHITKTILFGSEKYLEAGKAYTINLHLGMNSVKFDADVTAWENMLPASDIDLPANMPTFAATSSAATANAAIPGSAVEYIFAVSGLTGGEFVTAEGAVIENNGSDLAYEVNSTSEFTGGTGNGHANASGVVYIKLTNIKAYTDVKNKPNADAIVVTGASGNKVTISVTQLAEKLGLAGPATAEAGNSYDITSNVSVAANWQVSSSATTPVEPYIKVWINGAELSKTTGDSPAEKEFTFTPADDKATIKLGETTVSGDVVKVCIKTGDVPEETISITIPTPAP